MDKEYSFERVYQPFNITAKIKSQAEDFIVQENLSIDFTGEGEHCWLYIEKRHCNTDWVATQLAKYCAVKKPAVSYAGLKDRRAVSSQWFSVQLPGRATPVWGEFESLMSQSGTNETVRVLQCYRHNKKLQRGALKSNSFKITLRELSNTEDSCLETLLQRCDDISKKGVANYFGSQRFGKNFNNLAQAEKLFLKPRYKLPRHKRSMYLSASRSLLFNSILSERVKQKVWDKRLAGDVFMLDGKSACFKDVQDATGVTVLDSRLANREIHPAAILWGGGDSMVTLKAAQLEADIIDQFPVFRDGLLAARLKAQRRACRVVPQNMCSSIEDGSFIVHFSLPPGSYATVVLAEIFSDIREVDI